MRCLGSSRDLTSKPFFLRQSYGELTPHLPRHFHQPVKFTPHVVFAHRFGVDAAETALGADGELFERNVTRGLVDAAFEVDNRFYVGALRCDEAQDDDFVLWDESQRLESTGAFAVVFQQNTIMLETTEELFGDGVVVAFTVPLRHELARVRVDCAGVAATDVNTEGHTREALDERVICVDGSCEISLRIFAAGTHSIERNLIDVGGVTRRVDLDVFAAGFNQFGDHLSLNCDDMVDKVVEAVVSRLRSFPAKSLRHPIGADERGFDRCLSHALGVTKLVQGYVSNQFQSFGGAAPGDDGGSGFIEVLFSAFQWVKVDLSRFIIARRVLRHVEAGDGF